MLSDGGKAHEQARLERKDVLTFMGDSHSGRSDHEAFRKRKRL